MFRADGFNPKDVRLKSGFIFPGSPIIRSRLRFLKPAFLASLAAAKISSTE